jgi:hypothetical protein
MKVRDASSMQLQNTATMPVRRLFCDVCCLTIAGEKTPCYAYDISGCGSVGDHCAFDAIQHVCFETSGMGTTPIPSNPTTYSTVEYVSTSSNGYDTTTPTTHTYTYTSPSSKHSSFF